DQDEDGVKKSSCRETLVGRKRTQKRQKARPAYHWTGFSLGAGYGTRTRRLLLGKQHKTTK
ncbi:hypothetical protein, partial [Faecalibacterium hattorii]|uniref:hypothetical protein n=1 Tax=Faecalibacterium hattorii TaxID=2935520 RepID=UPI003AADE1EF